jgi:Glycosyl transferase family 2
VPDLAPIVLFVYNRPEHTRRTLTALAANPMAVDSDLIIYADGSKKPEHQDSVQAVRDLVRNTSGFKSLKIVERETNFGLAESIVSGVSEVCAADGRVIVVEDDLVVAPDFLSFLNAGLTRYRDEERVFQISGYSYPAHDQSTPPSFFLPMVSCWGWATWSRAWAKFDPTMSALTRLDNNPVARRQFNVDDTYDYYGMACQQRQGRIDSWGIRWHLSLFAADGLVLYPRDSLVYNAGAHGLSARTERACSRRRRDDLAGAHCYRRSGHGPGPTIAPCQPARIGPSNH